jgi:hypothetical protein
MSEPLTSHQVANMLLARPDTDLSFPAGDRLKRVQGIEEFKRDGDGRRFLVLDDGETKSHRDLEFMGRLNLEASLRKPKKSFRSGPPSDALAAAQRIVGALDDVASLLKTITAAKAKLGENQAPDNTAWINVCLAAENASLSLGLTKEE